MPTCSYSIINEDCGKEAMGTYQDRSYCLDHLALVSPVDGGRFHPVEAGASTPAKEAPNTMPETGGGKPPRKRAGSGAPISRHSPTPKPTASGKPRTPGSGKLGPNARALQAYRALTQAEGLAPPVEMILLNGPALVTTAKHQIALDVGVWVLARYPADDTPMDGGMLAYDPGDKP